MNLCSKSKTQLIRYVQLLRKNLKSQQEIIDQLVLSSNELQDMTRQELDRQNDIWHHRLIEAEEIHRLKTVDLERHNEVLSNLITKRAALQVHPSVVVLLDYAKYEIPDYAKYEIPDYAKYEIPDYAKYESMQKELKGQYKINANLTKQVDDLRTQIRNAAETLVKSI